MDVDSGEGVSVGRASGVSVGKTIGVSIVDVATMGVCVAAAAGVAVTMEGVRVGGRKGVGGLYPPGWKNQPLQALNKKTDDNTIRVLFISSPKSLYPAREKRAK
jgi:hypothetical protein